MRVWLTMATLACACFVDEPSDSGEAGESGGTSTSSTPSTSAPSSTSEPSGTASTSSDPSTGDTPSSCGNGIVEEGELCDDGDDLAGDGCNPDCVPSGSVIWTLQLEHLMPDTTHTLWDVAIDGEQVIALGQLGIAETEVGRPFTLVVDANDGEQLGYELADESWELWRRLAVAPDRSWIAVAGLRDPPATIYQGIAMALPIDLGTPIARNVIGSPEGRDELPAVVMTADNLAIYGGGLWSELDPLEVTRPHLEARDLNGSLLWWSDDFGDGNSITDIALAGDGSIVVIGAITPMEGYVAGWAIKLSPDAAATVWERMFTVADRHEFLFGLALDSNDDALVASTSYGDDSTLELRKLAADDGAEIWARPYDGLPDGADSAFDVAVDDTDAAVVVGLSQRAGEQDNIWVRKYDGAGLELWTFVEDGLDHGSDTATAVTTDELGNIYVGGRSAVDGLPRARLLKLAP